MTDDLETAKRLIASLLREPSHTKDCGNADAACHACEAQQFVGWAFEPMRNDPTVFYVPSEKQARRG